MAGEIAVKITSDEAKILDVYRKTTAELANMAQGMEKVSAASKRAAQEEAEMARQARRIFDDTRTPMEEYKRQLENLDKLYKAGSIDLQTYQRASKNAFTELETSARGAKGEVDKTGQSMKQAFAAGASEVKNFAVQLIGVGTAASEVMKLLEGVKKLREGAAASARESELDLGELSQLSLRDDGTVDKEKFKKLVAAARKTYSEGGAPSMGAAGKITFALESAGALEERQLFSDLYSSGTVHDPASMARSAKTIISGMGSQEAGTFTDVVSKAFAASKFTPARAEQLLEGTARGATGASKLGISDEELLAGNAIVSSMTGSADLAGTQNASLMKSLRKLRSGATGGSEDTGPQESISDALGKKGAKLTFDFAGKSLMEMLKQIRATATERGLTDADLMKLFGRQEALKAYEGILANDEEYGKALKSIRGAAAARTAEQVTTLWKSDPGLAAAHLARIGKAGAEVAKEEMGTSTNLAEAVKAEYEKRVAEGSLPASFGSKELDLAVTDYRLEKGKMLPGQPRRLMLDALRKDVLTQAPELESRAVGEVGGEAEVWGYDQEARDAYHRRQGLGTGEEYRARERSLANQMIEEGRFEDDARGMREALRAAAKSLEESARNLRDSTRGGTTLARPDEDK